MKIYKIKNPSNPKEATAWKWFSKYIRLRDAIKTTGDMYYAKCITCGEIKPMEDIDAGHGIPGRNNSILFNELITNAQCRTCNRKGKGEYQKYKSVLVERHGQEMFDLWMFEKKKPLHYTEFDYEQLTELYKKKVKQLKSGELKNE